MQFASTELVSHPYSEGYGWYMAMWCIPGSATEGNPKELGSIPAFAITEKEVELWNTLIIRHITAQKVAKSAL